MPTEEEALQQALRQNAEKYNFSLQEAYAIDTLIPYEEYALEQTDTVNIGPLTKEQGRKFRTLLTEFADLFAKDITELGRTQIVQHKIYTEDVPPINSRPYNVPPDEQNFIKEEIERMLESGIIQPSESPWTSPVVLVRKKNGKLRFCVDYRKLNSITKKDAYPLPRIQEMLNTLAGSQWFSTLDLASGYWQVMMDPKDREKTAFITKYGIYEFNVMPFGLCNAPATFQRLMDRIYKGLIWKSVVVYLDDTNIFSRTFDEHLKHLRIVFQRIRDAGLKLNLEKCNFWMKSLPFLGHIVSSKGIAPDPSKIETVQKIQPPNNVTKLRSFLGLVGYYRQFIRNFSATAQPLNQLLHKDTPYHWGPKQQEAFEFLKQKLITAPVLAYPDFKRRFILATDASYHGYGATLSQKDDNGKEHPIAYASKSLRPEEQNYFATELECAAIVWAIEHFHSYIGAAEFTLVTDHLALKWLKTVEPKGRIGRWILKLQPYNFVVIHKPGRIHSNVDALSRL